MIYSMLACWAHSSSSYTGPGQFSFYTYFCFVKKRNLFKPPCTSVSSFTKPRKFRITPSINWAFMYLIVKIRTAACEIRRNKWFRERRHLSSSYLQSVFKFSTVEISQGIFVLAQRPKYKREVLIEKKVFS